MNLSPRNLLDARYRLMPARSLEDDSYCEGDGKVREVTAYRCPGCGALHEWRDDAEECCARLNKPDAACACPVCGHPNDTYFQAVDCCLWIDLDFAARLKVAAALENGSDWKTELALP